MQIRVTTNFSHETKIPFYWQF